MRVFVIGNSHAACFKNGWEEVKRDYPNVDLTFFAARGKTLSALKPGWHVLKAGNRELRNALRHTSGGRKLIDPRKADAILCCGMGLRVPRGMGVFHSRQVKEAAVKYSVERSLAYDIFRKLRKVTDKFVHFAHNPLPASASHCDESEDEYEACLQMINAYTFESRNAQVLAQPDETIAPGLRSHPEFSVGSRRLDTGDGAGTRQHNRDDVRHMNTKFGIAWLRMYMEVLLADQEAS